MTDIVSYILTAMMFFVLLLLGFIIKTFRISMGEIREHNKQVQQATQNIFDYINNNIAETKEVHRRLKRMEDNNKEIHEMVKSHEIRIVRLETRGEIGKNN